MVIWTCPKCMVRERTLVDPPYAPMHSCKGMAGMSMPYVREGAKVYVHGAEREDYVGEEMVQYDGNGRPIMAIVHTYDDHEDRTVYAPSARFQGGM